VTWSAACLLGSSNGVAPSDAVTAAVIVCRELRAAGADVSLEPVRELSSKAAYRVDIYRLGNIFVLDLAF
jgi:hypothetical protein